MNRNEALQEMARQRGVDIGIPKAALVDANREAVQTIIQQIKMAQDSQYIIPKYIEELVKVAHAKNKLLEIADLLIDQPNHSLPLLCECLVECGGEKAVALLRHIILLSWAREAQRMCGANALIQAVYKGNAEQALLDEAELVRFAAVQQLESQNQVDGLIAALQNDAERVRRVAAWYMGRNKIEKAANILLEMVSTEADVETLRATVWALGVLRVKAARLHLEVLLQHSNPLICTTAQDALAKLTA